MKKLINAVDDVLTESLDGFAAAHADILVLGDDHKFVRRKKLKPGKVALISAAAPATSRCMRASSATACSMPPVPARSSPRRRPIR